MKRLGFWGIMRTVVSPPLGKGLTFDAAKGLVCTRGVSDLAGVATEIKLGTVAGQMGFAHVVICSDHAALEDREEVFDRVGVLEAARGDVLAGAVVDGAVSVKLAANAGVDATFVGHQRSEESRVGKEGVSTCRSRGSLYH